jgi:hypothetical protein
MIIFRHTASVPCMLSEGKITGLCLSFHYQALGSKLLDRCFVNSLLETFTFFWKLRFLATLIHDK